MRHIGRRVPDLASIYDSMMQSTSSRDGGIRGSGILGEIYLLPAVHNDH